MANMKYRMFLWPQDPEEFGISMVCHPEYIANNSGAYEYQGMGPVCRIYTGRGVFCGPEAVQQFNALQVLMATRVGGELVHPVWGTSNVVMTDLTMDQESRPDYIRYSFTFQTIDENGIVPRLPESQRYWQ